MQVLNNDPSCGYLLPCGWCEKFDKKCDGILYMNPPEEEDASQQSS